MTQTRRSILIMGVAALAAGAVSPAMAADQVVKVSLWDNGPDAMDYDGPSLAYGTPGASDMSKATMGIKASPTSVPAGKVTFQATNDSKDAVHEMIVAPLPKDGKPLPYIENEHRVDEEAAEHLGEVSELDPGQSGSLTVTLQPGKYILYCNIPGHYVDGMWTTITVTG